MTADEEMNSERRYQERGNAMSKWTKGEFIKRLSETLGAEAVMFSKLKLSELKTFIYKSTEEDIVINGRRVSYTEYYKLDQNKIDKFINESRATSLKKNTIPTNKFVVVYDRYCGTEGTIEILRYPLLNTEQIGTLRCDFGRFSKRSIRSQAAEQGIVLGKGEITPKILTELLNQGLTFTTPLF